MTVYALETVLHESAWTFQLNYPLGMPLLLNRGFQKTILCLCSRVLQVELFSCKGKKEGKLKMRNSADARQETLRI